MLLLNKTIVVTGASSGIGQAIAVEAAKKGAKVIIHYHRNKKGAEHTLHEVEKYSSGKIFFADLRDQDDVTQLFLSIKEAGYHAIDALVNNAGKATAGEFDDIHLWGDQLDVILMSQVYSSIAFINFAPTTSLRKIVNISSVYGIAEMGNPDFFQYSAAKAALINFTNNLAKKFAPHILINAVAPGYTWTPAWEGTSEDEKKKCTDLTRIKRFVTPEEIAHAVLSLLENDAMTGEVVRVDGGLHLLNLR